MIKKILLTGIISAFVALSGFSTAMAGLSIKNNSSINQITVKCGANDGKPIGKNQSFDAPWVMIYGILHDYSGSCVFFNNGKVEAEASLVINKNFLTATITNVHLDDPNLHVTFNPAPGTPAANISVVVSGG